MEKNKFLIDRIICQEKSRNLHMQKAYEEKIKQFPRGQLYVRTLNKGKKYCYLKYKENGKTITKYAGTFDLEQKLKSEIMLRKHFESLLYTLKKEYERMLKMERIK